MEDKIKKSIEILENDIQGIKNYMALPENTIEDALITNLRNKVKLLDFTIGVLKEKENGEI